MPRKRPYTQLGISRVPCTRCGAPSKFQWSICALNNLQHGVCAECDIELNAVVLQFFRVPDWQAKAAEYRRRVQPDRTEDLSTPDRGGGCSAQPPA